MRTQRLAWAITLLFFVMGLGASAWAKEFESVKKGYWWYKEEPKPPADDESENKPERKALPPLPPSEQLMKMHPADLKKMQQEYLEEAVWKLTPSSVLNSLVVQDAIRRKSAAFTAVSGMVMLENPQLYARKDNPITQQGIAAERGRRADAISERLINSRDEYGLIFLTQHGCGYCEIQRSYLKTYQEQTGWSIREYDVGDRPDIADRLGYNKQGIVPLTILIKRNGVESFPVAVGIESVAQLKDNAYRALRYMSGETTPEQFFNLEYQDGGAFDPRAEVKK